jgi:type I restriction enzyme R subunit
MARTPEDKAREVIDARLEKAGWRVCDLKDVNLASQYGIAIRDFPLKREYGFADYLLYVDGKAAGVIEAKKEGSTLTGVEVQADKYQRGLPDAFPAWYRPLPFSYESTGVETRFTNCLEPDYRSRNVFSFHKPEILSEWLRDNHRPESDLIAESRTVYNRPETLLSRLQKMPALIEAGLWPAQIRAIKNLEQSLADNRPRALIQMATGSGKTFTAVSFIYRLLRFAGARRVLFLVDRANLGRQTLKEFQQYQSPYNPYKFTEEYIVQQLASGKIDKTARVCISTIQRLYSILRGEELTDEDDEQSIAGLENVIRQPAPVEYNPAVPIETFDIIVTDECHRSIYNLWRQVLEYFDAYIIGLTATPNKQTFGFFNRNLVMEYPHDMAVADNVNVNYDVYQIRTRITEAGSTVDAGYFVDKRDRETRAVRWEKLDEEFAYAPGQLDREVVAVDQIRTIVRTFRDKLFTEIFPDRTVVPKTLIYAKDDSHAEDIVKIVREEFNKGNEFCRKITYKTTGVKPDKLIASFKNSYFPRIVVTVDMIATGTDIKPLEIVLFLRQVQSRGYFEQMKGRGVRVINETDLQAVTPDAKTKDHFVIVDAVGVCEAAKTDSRPMERKRTVPLEKLIQAVALGSTDTDIVSSIVARFARLERRISKEDNSDIRKLADGRGLKELTGALVQALDPDKHIEQAKADNPGVEEPTDQQVKASADKIIKLAAQPLYNPILRDKILDIYKKTEQTIDTVSVDEVTSAGFSAAALEKAKGLVTSFEQFINENRDEITALQILYSRPYKARLNFEQVKELAALIEKPPYYWRVDNIWNAYATLEKSRVRGASGQRLLTDLVSLVRFAMRQENELAPFPERVTANFDAWLAGQESKGRKFNDEQRRWLEMIRDHITANLSIENADFDYAPFAQEGGLGKVYQVFGAELNGIIEELNGVLAA